MRFLLLLSLSLSLSLSPSAGLARPLIVVLFFLAPLAAPALLTPLTAQAPIPVTDEKHDGFSRVLQTTMEATRKVATIMREWYRQVEHIQEGLHQSITLVSRTVKNLRLLRQITDQIKAIQKMAATSINAVRQLTDEQLPFTDKYRHIQIILSLAAQSDDAIDLFRNVISDNGLVMDDEGRLTLLQDAYRDTRRIKAALRVEIRRINRDVYRFKRLRRELDFYQTLFEQN